VTNVLQLYSQQTDKTKAWVWTIAVHILLLLFFLLFSYSIPDSETMVPDMGMEVNLGTSDDGSGDSQPMDEDDPAPNRAASARKVAAAEHAATKEMEHTDEADAPAVANQQKKNTDTRNRTQTETKKSNNRQTNATANNTTPAQSPRYVYQGGTGKGGNSAGANAPGTGEGNTTGPGDRGVPGGTPGAANYTGNPGTGNGGISHNLDKRSIVAFPPPDADFKEGGRVVVRITVNRQGNIVGKQVVSASNGELRGIALRKLDKVRFNKKDDAPEEQFGNITFVFKTRS
jgi:outer membrane biosynthesis protein TonB